MLEGVRMVLVRERQTNQHIGLTTTTTLHYHRYHHHHHHHLNLPARVVTC